MAAKGKAPPFLFLRILLLGVIMSVTLGTTYGPKLPPFMVIIFRPLFGMFAVQYALEFEQSVESLCLLYVFNAQYLV